MRHIIPISGKDSAATALVQVAREPSLPYEFLFTDVGAELPETYAWLKKVESETGWPIKRVGHDLQARVRAYNGFLPGPKSRYCTRETKIEPMEAWIGEDEATIYYGLRADEVRTGYVPIGKRSITPTYPLRDLGIDLQGVYSILDARNLMPPDFFWPRLYQAVETKLAHLDWQSRLSRTERTIAFAGRTRANCFFCFFQRQYEYLWLSETHPDLFEQAKGMEKEDYTFQPGFALRDLECPNRRARIFEDRVKQVAKLIGNKFQGELFGEVSDNELALVSCGLLCGK